jgi:hypothetical protein
MSIDVYATPLWAELATWRPSALADILRPEFWAVHGTTRLGKALTWHDRLEAHELTPAVLLDGARAAGAMMDLLARLDGEAVRWEEAATPGARNTDDVVRALGEADSDPSQLAPHGLELVVEIAHALQSGGDLGPDAGEHEIRALVEARPRVAQQPGGPFAALLAASMDTIWIPTPMRTSWDGPAGTFASAARLRDDLDALPALLRHIDADGPDDLLGAQLVVESLRDALAHAGSTRCVRITG